MMEMMGGESRQLLVNLVNKFEIISLAASYRSSDNYAIACRRLGTVCY